MYSKRCCVPLTFMIEFIIFGTSDIMFSKFNIFPHNAWCDLAPSINITDNLLIGVWASATNFLNSENISVPLILPFWGKDFQKFFFSRIIIKCHLHTNNWMHSSSWKEKKEHFCSSCLNADSKEFAIASTRVVTVLADNWIEFMFERISCLFLRFSKKGLVAFVIASFIISPSVKGFFLFLTNIKPILKDAFVAAFDVSVCLVEIYCYLRLKHRMQRFKMIHNCCTTGRCIFYMLWRKIDIPIHH